MDMTRSDFDVAIIGAGMAGLYALYRCRSAGLRARVIEAADDVGGTWHWNRYPGARCDIESIDYCYTFDQELETEWAWSERYATQPEILRYLRSVADRHNLRPDIVFSTRMRRARWDADSGVWGIETSPGDDFTARWLVMATGCLSVSKTPEIPGITEFRGETYLTGQWPHEPVSFAGKRVAVVGTGSSAVQCIPLIAREAASLSVFQRTPAYSIPAHNGPLKAEKRAQLEGRRDAYREAARYSPAGVPRERSLVGALQVSAAERLAAYEAMWEAGDLLGIGGAFADILRNREANETLCEFIRGKIRTIVSDPHTAEMLCPFDYPIATKRPCLDSGYYETFNRPNVRLIDLRATPIGSITPEGIAYGGAHETFDAIVFATGFDAMTGALLAPDIIGRGGLTLRQSWKNGPRTYLGLMSEGFPNLFMVTGPGSPSVLSNMAVSIEQHVDWIADTLIDLRAADLDTIEPSSMAQEGWERHARECVDLSLFREASSWYSGANVEGKPPGVMPYVGGVDVYRIICEEVRSRGYLGFRRSGPGGEICNDGEICRLKPDIAGVLRALAELRAPPLETLPAEKARAMIRAGAAGRPPGPAVAAVEDGSYEGAAGPLGYRLYHPGGVGPWPVCLYFHGGGWVLGDSASDDPLCRYLCAHSGAIIISADYRHAPESPYPAAHQDAAAALDWVLDNRRRIGGAEGPVVVAGWSAGANLAASLALSRGVSGGISGQALLTPVADTDLDRPSYLENAQGYGLTRPLMGWFLDQYLGAGVRDAERVQLIGQVSADAPPTLVIACEFDPLRDEGVELGRALQASGVPAELVVAEGQTHASIPMVDVVVTAEPYRRAMANAIRRFGASA
jgi:cation diffusion facilitator CzcD-associated flavoprotein CzcO/acetyl esterase/lipase